jgi:hypothetical protein
MRLALAFFLVGWFGIHGETILGSSAGCGDPSGCAEKDVEPQRAHQIATITTAACCALVGALLARRRRNWPGAAVYLPMAGGALNAALLAVILTNPETLIAAIPFGVAYAGLYVPAAWILCLAYHDSKIPGELWRATAATLIAWSLLDGFTKFSPIAGPGLAAATAAAILTCRLLVDGRRLLYRPRPAPPQAGGPYRQAPITPIEDPTPLFRRAALFDGLLLLPAAALLAFWSGR